MRNAFGSQQLQERGAAGNGLGGGQVSIHMFDVMIMIRG